MRFFEAAMPRRNRHIARHLLHAVDITIDTNMGYIDITFPRSAKYHRDQIDSLGYSRALEDAAKFVYKNDYLVRLFWEDGEEE